MTDTSHTVAPDESRHYVERLSLVLSDMGFPPMPARVWAALMTSETPSSTPGDLGSRLGVSPAAISGAVRYLQQVGLIERVAVPRIAASALLRQRRHVGRRVCHETVLALPGLGSCGRGHTSPR